MVGMTCVGFSKNVSISVTEFVMASIVDTKGVLVDCGFFLTIYADSSALVFGI